MNKAFVAYFIIKEFGYVSLVLARVIKKFVRIYSPRFTFSDQTAFDNFLAANRSKMVHYKNG